MENINKETVDTIIDVVEEAANEVVVNNNAKYLEKTLQVAGAIYIAELTYKGVKFAYNKAIKPAFDKMKAKKEAKTEEAEVNNEVVNEVEYSVDNEQ